MHLHKICFFFSFSLLLCGFSFSVQSGMELPPSFKYFDLEMPMRCQVDAFNEQNLATFVPLTKKDFTVRLPLQTGVLPRFQVNNFSFRKQPLDRALVNLFHETQIEVESELEVCPILSATSLNGELSAVVEELTKQAGVFFTYDTEKKILTLKEKSQAVIQLPKDKSVMMAVVDAMSGGMFNPISTDWHNYQITLTLTRGELEKVRHLLASLLKDKYLLSVQMSIYEVKPNAQVFHWQQILSAFGSDRVASSTPGTGGNLMVLKPMVNAYQLVAKAMNYDRVVPLAQGKTVVPSGWRVHFNFGECMLESPYTKMAVLFSSDIKNKSQAKSTLTIDSKEGEVVSFDFASALNQEAAVIGIPVPNKSTSELLLVMKFNYINLTKEGA